MKVDGSCHCGAITFEAEIDPERVRICHCTDCQQLSGTAFRVNVPCPENQFHLRKGEPRIYVKTAESGGGADRHSAPIAARRSMPPLTNPQALEAWAFASAFWRNAENSSRSGSSGAIRLSRGFPRCRGPNRTATGSGHCDLAIDTC